MPLKTISNDEQPAMNLTSMIDVMALLVIFFMVGAKFADDERAMSVRVPQVSTTAGAPTAAPTKRTINVRQDGQITLDRQTVTVAQLKVELVKARQANPKLGVIVRGDAHAVHQNIASVLAACRDAGVTDLGISVKVASKPEGTLR